MKLGMHIRLPDGRVGTVVYNSLIGVGIMWGLLNPDPADFEGTNGNTVSSAMPTEFLWEPEALLREPFRGCEKCGFLPNQCVGEKFEIIEG